MDIEYLEEIVNRWCPKCFSHENFQIRMVRAILALGAYETCAKATLAGEPNPGPDFPLPLPIAILS